MASRLFLLIALFLFFISQVSSEATFDDRNNDQQVEMKGPNNRKLLQFPDCAGLCNARCSLHSRPNVCTRACGTCCARCKCVPPGTSGNRHVCGKCYTDMTTHGNRLKCP